MGDSRKLFGDLSLFGTDGIRGVANQHPMTADVALAVGRALAYVFQRKGHHRKVLIGKDTRLSGYMLETALASGISSMGADVLLVGPMPTPGVAFLTGGMRADAGVMISASHNSYEDNGIKIFDSQGFKLPDEAETKLESLIFSKELEGHFSSPSEIGKAFRVEESRGRYLEFLKGTFPRGLNLEGVKLVVDCANGAAYEVAPTVFEELGAQVVRLGVEPNGVNINAGVGATSPKALADAVKRSGADLGVALDGDGDRAVFVNEKGKIVPGDAILAICARDLNKRNLLQKNTVVGTVMSNVGLEEFLKHLNISLVRTPVGDRYIVECMREKGYNFGGETSGHVVFRDHATTGDGVLAALQVLALSLRESKSLGELAKDFNLYPQVLKNVRVEKRVDLNLYPVISKKIKEVENTLGSEGRLLVRYSGTEPLIRVMVEGQDSKKIEVMASEIASCVETSINSL